MFHKISNSLIRRKIQKCQRQLGNGHDVELYLRIAGLHKHLGEDEYALASYHAAADNLVKKKAPLDTESSDRLIDIYKTILSVSPLNEDTTNKLGQEYFRRGMSYRAVSLHTLLAERYTRIGKYQQAVDQYHQIIALQPVSIMARQRCAEIYCRMGNSGQGAKEYAQIGDLCFEHQKFDKALEYYQQAYKMQPDNENLKQRILLLQQLQEETIIPRAQASLQKLWNMTHLRHSLAEKDRIEQELRQNIQLLKQRYQQSISVKNQELQTTRQRLEELSTYVGKLKNTLKQVEHGKQHLKEQLAIEAAYKKDLEDKLQKLGTLQVSEHSSDPQASPAYVQRLELAVNRLKQEKTKLKTLLRGKLKQSSNRETQLQQQLAVETSRGTTLEQQLKTTTQERDHVEQTLQYQLQESLQREQMLREQLKRLINQHHRALKHLEYEKHLYKKKYKTAQARMNAVETHNITTLKQLHGELSRQYEIESGFSEKLHDSLEEIAMLLHTQEQEIQKLECL